MVDAASLMQNLKPHLETGELGTWLSRDQIEWLLRTNSDAKLYSSLAEMRRVLKSEKEKVKSEKKKVKKLKAQLSSSKHAIEACS